MLLLKIEGFMIAKGLSRLRVTSIISISLDGCYIGMHNLCVVRQTTVCLCFHFVHKLKTFQEISIL